MPLQYHAKIVNYGSTGQDSLEWVSMGMDMGRSGGQLVTFRPLLVNWNNLQNSKKSL